MSGASHRATLRRNHKSFKSKHASKSSVKAKNKGKIEKDSTGKGKPYTATKNDRRNTANQIKSQKLVEVAINRKLFDGRHGAPKIIAIVPLSTDINPEQIVRSLNNSVEINIENIPNPGITTVRVDRFKQSLQYIIPPRNFMAILDACKVADFVVFALSSVQEVDEFGELCIRSIESQGVSSVTAIISNLNEIPGTKRQYDVKNSLLSYFTHFFPAEDKIYAIDMPQDALNVTRSLCQRFPKGIHWRDSRSYLLADNVTYEASTTGDASDGLVVVEGIVRGRGMNSNRLVHIPGFGDYQVEKITKQVINDKAMDDESEILARPDNTQETLDELAPLEVKMSDDEYDNEEEFRGFEDIDNADNGVRLDDHHYFRDHDKEAFANKWKTRKLPKGMSEYQARWLVDDDQFSDDDESATNENYDDDMMMGENGEDGFGEARAANTEYAVTEAGDVQSEVHMELSQEEEERQFKLFKQREREDLEFPDEIEVDPSVSARERFHRYRGLKNLRSCTWDSNEHDPRSPEQWERLAKFTNYHGTKNKIMKNAIVEAQVQAGTRIRIYLRAPQEVVNSFIPASPFVVYCLLEHEHKQAAINITINASTEYEAPVKAKDTLILQLGPKRLVINPLFSQAGNAGNGVYKYERYLQRGRASVATVMGPVMFGNVPALYFKQNGDKLEMIGTGSFLDTNHSRVLAKRVVLTGHPFKIHKRLVTIRYMFFSAEDIAWFKAVPLFTKMGKSGFIKESLGTHGYFKATFDGKIDAQDTIAMALYKRVWPRPSSLWNGAL
ncbi:DUF663-domain-containing protein [Nadsonia fulvescens var. elongata DSM 6958]|uniref:DUF663-domain-containing protein n=1 Tax=Nadsonia fulvescens var. elongata DSM 6958 TaxID=857566 RepID=A0A1E3PGB1_9ASCO|nr:DUF663-domain-containing protein [Nadsonia fulvescens var. elongata DSM 6958]